jgi:Tfp pilus assembly protein PilX
MKGSGMPARASTRGVAMVTALYFVLIISILLIGIATYCASHEQRATYDANYAAALDLAEAGVNWELRKISNNVSQADTVAVSMSQPFGVPSTSYTVQCVNRGTTTPWSGPGTYLDVIATGSYKGVSRSIRVSVRGYSTQADYAVFARKQGNVNGSPLVEGSIGTNTQLNINGNPTITGSVVLNGTNATANINPPGRFTPVHNPDPVVWQTVDQIASAQFPGGLSYLASHNDNALASPAITNNTVLLNGNGSLTFNGKPGGANYYLTGMILNGNAKVYFNNSSGPITIWFGPSGQAGGGCNLNGGTASIKMSSDSSKAVRIYVAQTSSVNINGNSELDAGIYAYNGESGGTVNFNGTGDIYGMVVANNFNFNGNVRLHYTSGYFSSGGGYYGFDNMWVETNPR